MELRPLSSALGVEVLGLDVSVSPADDVRQAVYEAWLEHHLVLVRGQQLTVEQQLAFAGWFGTVRAPYPPVPAEVRDPSIRYGYISNARPDGRGSGNSELVLHQDLTFATPVGGICMYPIELPDSGGDTGYYNAELALQRLSAPLRHRITDLVAVHVETFMPPEVASRAEHKVVWEHPETHRPILFVTRLFTEAIIGLDPEESRALLDELLLAFNDPSIQYWHHWEYGDVLIWDNCSLQHARKSFPPDQQRTLQRCHTDYFSMVPA